MFRLLTLNGLFGGWNLSDKEFESIEDAKAEVEKRVNNGQSLNSIKIVQVHETLVAKII